MNRFIWTFLKTFNGKIAAVCLLAALNSPTLPARESCPPDGYPKPRLLELQQSGFELDDDAERNALALSLLDCVGDPDPAIRDGVVYEGLAGWLRGKHLSTKTIDMLYRALSNQLNDEPDEDGFGQPFAALLLAEVARTDRIEPGFGPRRRSELVGTATRYLAGVRDYRGFSDREGWRHGVAHGADLVLQLVLNTEIGADQVRRLLAAVSSQVAPAGEHFYVYGEPARLARPVIHAYLRGIFDHQYWAEWIDAVAGPTPMADWSDAYSSNIGLARRHNTLAFLTAVYLNANALQEGQGLAAIALDSLRRIR